MAACTFQGQEKLLGDEITGGDTGIMSPYLPLISPMAAQQDFRAAVASDPENVVSELATMFLRYPVLAQSMGEMSASLKYVL
jgi:hypothetical protein